MEELISDMPLLPIGCSVDGNLTVDGHNEVEARYRMCSFLLEISTRHRRIIDPGQFLTGGPP